MNHQSVFVSALISYLFLSGCMSTGFNRGDLRDQTVVAKPVYDDKDIKEAFNKKSNLPKPFSLAVYFKSPTPNRNGEAPWRWTEEDKKVLEDIGAELKAEGLVSNIFPVIGSVVANEDLRSIRMAAAKHQADTLLVVGGAAQTDRYVNRWGWSYILLVPTLFVRGSEADTLFIVNAALWDVRRISLFDR